MEEKGERYKDGDKVDSSPDLCALLNGTPTGSAIL
jgi:hypothetical protein